MTHRNRLWLAATALLAVTSGGAAAQQSDSAFALTIPDIMRGPALIGDAPTDVRWTPDGKWIYFRWKPGGLAWDAPLSQYRVPSTGGLPEKVSDAQADSMAPLLARGVVSGDRRWEAVSSDGDLYLIDLRKGGLRRLTETRDAEVAPVFSSDGGTLFFREQDNLFGYDMAGGTLRQLTDVRAGQAPAKDRPATGQKKFLEDQQAELFAHIRRQEKREEERRARDEQETAHERQALYLARGERVRGLAIDPAGTYAVITAGAGAGDARRTTIPEWVTESGYTETINGRSKVGDAQAPAGRIGILGVVDGKVRWLDVQAATGDPKRELGRIRFVGWNRAGTAGLVGATSADFKDGWIFSLDPATGALAEVMHDHDDAWIGGPCDAWSGCSGWMPDGHTVYFTSERSGFNHVYTAEKDGTGLRQLTSGDWEVQNVDLAPGLDRFYLTTNEGSPHEVHFYHMTFSGQRTRITTTPGRQDVTPSPDGKRLAIIHSYVNAPPELYVADDRPGARMTRITTSPTAAWRAFPWIAPEIIHVRARDGVEVPARIYRPSDVGARPNGAAVIFVHGAGYLQNVHNWWSSSYYHEYMFHHLLARRGYVVLALDYRGSAGYGRDWRTAIYRHMGGKDLDDQVDGSRYLTATFGIPADRIGIYGGSYGGFMTLMALFTAPESFGAGAALRSVTDWAHYNNGYTGEILNLPQDDSVAYRQSSPIYYAEGLEDPLLIAHGMVDTNVHFSDVVRLTQRLIELGKTDWELAVYPVENHGFVEPASWTDEYRRILELFDRSLLKDRPGGS